MYLPTMSSKHLDPAILRLGSHVSLISSILGVPGLIKEDMVKEGTVVIDVGKFEQVTQGRGLIKVEIR